MSVATLIHRIHKDDLYWAVCKLIGYDGFPFRELAARMRPLVEQYGARKVSLALSDVASHTGWRTRLNTDARRACFSVLGPAPERWDDFYRDGLGNPTPRPAHHQTPPIDAGPLIEPILDALTRLTATELDMKLSQCRATLRKQCPEHERQLAGETVPRVESEMVRRGQDIPPEEPAEEPSKKRARKKG